MAMGRNRWACGVLVTAVAMALAACGDKKKQPLHPDVAAQDRRVAPIVHPALKGTIGEVAALANSGPVRVESYGIVADLPNTGSSEMPPPVREILMNDLYKAKIGSFQNGTEEIRPEDLLNSKHISAVSVVGMVPALSPEGTSFDLYVTALPGTQTTSLEYGLLWTCDMGLIAVTENGSDTRPIARGRGPVFCNPFVNKLDSKGQLIKRNVRSGRVMAGGRLTENLPVTLQLYTPSYRISAQIQRAVNGRFPGQPPFASALSDSLVSLTIPPEFHDHPRRFVDIVAHMYMAQDVPGFTERKTAELLAALQDPHAPHKDLGLALEGLGRTIIPAIENSYTSENAAVRFYASRAGAALGDSAALVVLESIARNDQSPWQYDAISAIADHGDSMRSNTVLTNLLNTNNMRVRIAAYEGLLHVNSPALNSFSVGRKFIVDRLVTDGPPVIYATQTGIPRIALIGKKFTLPIGSLYISADEILTVSYPDPQDNATDATPAAAAGFNAPAAAPVAKADPDPVQLYYRGPMGNQHVLLKSNPSLGVVIAKLGYIPDPRAGSYDANQPYIGVSYQRVLEMLDKMCKEHTLDATFMMQPQVQDDLSLAAQANAERPETNTPLQAAVPATQPATAPAIAPQSPRSER